MSIKYEHPDIYIKDAKLRKRFPEIFNKVQKIRKNRENFSDKNYEKEYNILKQISNQEDEKSLIEAHNIMNKVEEDIKKSEEVSNLKLEKIEFCSVFIDADFKEECDEYKERYLKLFNFLKEKALGFRKINILTKLNRGIKYLFLKS